MSLQHVMINENQPFIDLIRGLGQAFSLWEIIYAGENIAWKELSLIPILA